MNNLKLALVKYSVAIWLTGVENWDVFYQFFIEQCFANNYTIQTGVSDLGIHFNYIISSIAKKIYVLTYANYDIQNWQIMFSTLGQLPEASIGSLIGNFAICANGTDFCILECYNQNLFGNYPGGNLTSVDLTIYGNILPSGVGSQLIGGNESAQIWSVLNWNHHGELNDILSFILDAESLPTLIS